MSNTLSLKNVIRASFDEKFSSTAGTWEFEFDEEHPDRVILRVCSSAGGQSTELVSHLQPDDVEQLQEWLQRVRSHMSECGIDPASRKSGDGVALTHRESRAAVIFNRARPYSADLWRVIQRFIGAGVDGVPGVETARKVARYQRQHGLLVDGKVGPGTLGNMNIGPVRSLDERAFFFVGKMAINADGAPNAYNHRDTGIDFLANAGRPGKWWGLAVSASGEPYIQEDDDPYPGYYVSTTALIDGTFPHKDPRRYVNSNIIPYIVLPRNAYDMVPTRKVRKGDLAVVVRRSHPDHVVYALYADVGPKKILDPSDRFGEGSLALAQALGHDPFVMRRKIKRAVRGMVDDIFYVIFPGSGLGRPLDGEELMAMGTCVFEEWGGICRLREALALYDE